MSKLLQLEVEIQNCVEDIKKKILDNEGIPLRDQVLYFNNRILPDYETDTNKITYSNLDGFSML